MVHRIVNYKEQEIKRLEYFANSSFVCGCQFLLNFKVFFKFWKPHTWPVPFPFPSSIPMFPAFPLKSILSSSLLSMAAYIHIYHVYMLVQLAKFIYCCSCTHIFRPDHLGLDNISGGFTLENNVSLNSNWLYIHHYVGMGLVIYSLSMLACQLTLSLCWFCLGDHIVEIWCCIKYIYRKYIRRAGSRKCLLSTFSLSFFKPISFAFQCYGIYFTVLL